MGNRDIDKDNWPFQFTWNLLKNFLESFTQVTSLDPWLVKKFRIVVFCWTFAYPKTNWRKCWDIVTFHSSWHLVFALELVEVDCSKHRKLYRPSSGFLWDRELDFFDLFSVSSIPGMLVLHWVVNIVCLLGREAAAEPLESVWYFVLSLSANSL